MKPIQSVLVISVVSTVLSIVFVAADSGGLSDGRVAASGAVYLDDHPVAEADIFLTPAIPTAETRSYHGRTDSTGQYEVAGGVVPGEYRVVIRRAMAAVPSQVGVIYQPGEIDDGQMAAMRSAAESRAPQRSSGRNQMASLTQPPATYESAQHTTLRVMISDSGSHHADVHLTKSTHSRVALSGGGTASVR